ncbi:periplasmic chaperone for outer membrane proteins Skp [Thermodesulfobium acidiphilum]|uniref:Periplasmic chaperone for outer membrane proteins Skp n=1 Tax=Thermodesulfobium acidiphilum TaxID=1794699 RepID=A0A2R4VYB2_THEAF|nr:OmpH family outer membrane protein [Thermodesulfobium acidiphilum]AWB09446.1 periplasmic chaperone for outer membrane proteins Skp [Thermodesulfobium acidiphilum]
MKKSLLLFVCAILVLFTFQTKAMAKDNVIAYIDLVRVEAGVNELKPLIDQKNQVEIQFEQLRNQKQQEFAQAQASGESQEQLKKLYDQINQELAAKEKEVEAARAAIDAKLQTVLPKIKNAIDSVAKQVGASIVLDNAIVWWGGVDITDQVIAKVNGQ